MEGFSTLQELAQVRAQLEEAQKRAEAAEAKLAEINAALPDNFSESKDWRFDKDPIARIEWLKFFTRQEHGYFEALQNAEERVKELECELADAKRSAAYGEEVVRCFKCNRGYYSKDYADSCPYCELKLTFDAAYAAGRKEGMEEAAGMISGIDKIAGPLLAAAIREAGEK